MKIFNTLSKKVEDFTPINPDQVGMYTCGPTVYGPQHIGNFRSMLLSDILYRTLKLNGYSVKTVRNITDIDDKIIKNAAEKNLPIEEFTKEFTETFFQDLDKLNIIPVDIDSKATEHIEKMVKYIEVLIEKGFAYVEEDGSVYFAISKFPDYGKLSGLDKRELKTGTRILSDEYTKDNVQDFALWKSVKPDEVGYDSPWGKGRPGWHIECSVMSQEYLGNTFDLHLGGIDLIFPHHENEIAQAEAKTGQKFVNYFVHGEFVDINNEKMAKSVGNTFTIKDLEEKGFEPMAYRYLILTAHYRSKLNFTWESLQSAQNALNNLRSEVRDLEKDGEILEGYKNKFLEALNNDLNTPQALAVMWELVKSDEKDKGATILWMDQVLGLGLDQVIGHPVEIPEEVWTLVNQREEARKSGDYQKSDQLRDQVKELGFEIEDSSTGPKLKK
jgi:cysteinyl-tRNA synthetase